MTPGPRCVQVVLFVGAFLSLATCSNVSPSASAVTNAPIPVKFDWPNEVIDSLADQPRAETYAWQSCSHRTVFDSSQSFSARSVVFNPESGVGISATSQISTRGKNPQGKDLPPNKTVRANTVQPGRLGSIEQSINDLYHPQWQFSDSAEYNGMAIPDLLTVERITSQLDTNATTPHLGHPSKETPTVIVKPIPNEVTSTYRFEGIPQGWPVKPSPEPPQTGKLF